MKNKQGFTLIELLAVIVILSIITAISIPIIMELVEEAKRETFKNSANGILQQIEFDFSRRMVNNKATEEIIYTFASGEMTSEPTGYKLEFKGSKPKTGAVSVNPSGNITMTLHDGIYCAYKAPNEEKISIEKLAENLCTKENLIDN